jgi:hypothetical protein
VSSFSRTKACLGMNIKFVKLSLLDRLAGAIIYPHLD